MARIHQHYSRLAYWILINSNSSLVKTQESVFQATLERESLLDKISNSKQQIKQAESQLINAEIELEAAKSKHEEVGHRLFFRSLVLY